MRTLVRGYNRHLLSNAFKLCYFIIEILKIKMHPNNCTRLLVKEECTR